jgi:hypothetical protein
MKKVAIVSILFLIIISFTNCGNRSGNVENDTGNTSDTGIAVLSFKEIEHHFGAVKEGKKVGYVFTFENTGTKNLIITSASATCGCTVPRYNNKPVPPGGKGDLEVIFDTSGRSGIQTKMVSVRSNASIPVVLLRITADVKLNNNN